jgi:hypothetical protein
MKISGLSGKRMEIETGRWYLLRAKSAKFRDVGGNGARLEVMFVVAEGKFCGEEFCDSFFLSPKAVNRLHCFLSRAGYPKELLNNERTGALPR